jgi:hypothetical protein
MFMMLKVCPADEFPKHRCSAGLHLDPPGLKQFAGRFILTPVIGVPQLQICLRRIHGKWLKTLLLRSVIAGDFFAPYIAAVFPHIFHGDPRRSLCKRASTGCDQQK